MQHILNVKHFIDLYLMFSNVDLNYCRLAAVAERGENPSFHVFDLRTFRRKKTIVTSDILSKVSRYVCMVIMCIDTYLANYCSC